MFGCPGGWRRPCWAGQSSLGRPCKDEIISKIFMPILEDYSLIAIQHLWYHATHLLGAWGIFLAPVSAGNPHMSEDARPASGEPIGALAYWHRWAALFLLALAANTIIATLAWVVVGLVLK
jgi:hypothetical protein